MNNTGEAMWVIYVPAHRSGCWWLIPSRTEPMDNWSYTHSYTTVVTGSSSSRVVLRLDVKVGSVVLLLSLVDAGGCLFAVCASEIHDQISAGIVETPKPRLTGHARVPHAISSVN